jgi:hypothetical protein
MLVRGLQSGPAELFWASNKGEKSAKSVQHNCQYDYYENAPLITSIPPNKLCAREQLKLKGHLGARHDRPTASQKQQNKQAAG